MSVVMILAGLMFISGMKIAGEGSFHRDYCSVEKTTALKGVFVMLVFFQHFRTYITPEETDFVAVGVSEFLGQLIVVPFLFYSGFGVMESIRAKGNSYVRRIPVDRALKTLLHFDAAVLLFLALYLFRGNTVTWKNILLSLICLHGFGNSTWYIFAIVTLYLITAVSFTVFRKNKTAAATAVTVLTIAEIYWLMGWQREHWHNTLLCYSMGIWYSLFRERIEKILMGGDVIYLAALLGSVSAFAVFRNVANLYPWGFHVYALIFMMVLLLLSMKFSLDNPLLQFLGRHIFGMYILQRLPMIALRHLGIFQNNTVTLMVVCFLITCILTLLFEGFLKKMDHFLFRVKNKQETA